MVRMADFIARAQHDSEHPSTMVSNRLILDTRLKLADLGVMVRLLSLPDGWDMSISGLANAWGVGRDTVIRRLNNLERHGYVSMFRPGRNMNGKAGQLPVRLMVVECPNVSRSVPTEKWSTSNEPCPACYEAMQYSMMETNGATFRCPMCGVVYDSLDSVRSVCG